MPSGLAVIRWDDKSGAVLEASYPMDFEIKEDQPMRIYASHTMSEAKTEPFVTMKVGEMNVASYFSSIPEAREKFVIALFLNENESGERCERILSEISGPIILKRGEEGFSSYLKEVFESVSAEIELAETIPRRVLKDYGLSRDEAEAYLAMVDKGPVSLGEIGLYADVSEERANEISERLVRLGLLKTIPGTRRYFQGIPPYTALLKQLNDFRGFLTALQADVPTILADQFKTFEEEVGTVKTKVSTAFEEQLKMKVFKRFIEHIISTVLVGELDRLKELFEERVIEALRTIVSEADERVAVSGDTLDALWKRARSTITFRFTDVWFVTSTEGFKAQINDMFSRAKSRIIVVAPNLLDIDLGAMEALKSWVNVRIVTKVDLTNPETNEAYRILSEKPNVVVRNYERQDLWAMDKDREEILIGAVQEKGTPVGLASTLDEHIQMFMPIIEQAWLSARKL